MADWNKPALTDLYGNFLTYLNDKIKDAGYFNSPDVTTVTNPYTGMKRWNVANDQFEIYNGTTWAALTSARQKTSEKDATGGYVGMTLFKHNFVNAANTFVSYFTNSNSASRTYTFPDKDLIVAGTVDVAALLPAGTRLPFHQAAAPTGWTKDTTAALNDSAMRIVTGATGGGSGGTYNFSAGCTVVAAHTHTFNATSGNNSADHSHTVTINSNGGHSHSIALNWNNPNGGAYPAGVDGNSGLYGNNNTSSDGAHTHTTTVGGATAVHTHGISGTTADSNNSATWIPKYNDFIICSKN